MEEKVSEEQKKEIIKDIEKEHKVPEKIAVVEEALDEKEQLKLVKKEKKVSLDKSKKSAKGKVIQFRRGRKTIHKRHFLLDVGASNREEAKKFVKKIVEWKSPAGKIIKGEISNPHGNKGLVRAIFEKGLPGQAITTEVEVK